MLLVLLLISTLLTGAVVSKEALACYGAPGTPCTTTTLSCQTGEVIRLEDRGEKIEQWKTAGTKPCSCPVKDADTDTSSPADVIGRVSVYSRCSNQPSCQISSTFNHSSAFTYISYPYYCKSIESNLNMLHDVNQTLNGAVSLYLHNPRTTINRQCTIHSSLPLTVEGLYINLSQESIHKINIFADQQSLLMKVGDRFVALSEKFNFSGSDVKIVMDELVPEAEDFVWLQFTTDSNELSVFCNELKGLNTRPHSGSTVEKIHNITVIGSVGVVVVVVVAVFIIVVVFYKKKRRGKKRGRSVNSLSQDVCLSPIYSQPFQPKTSNVYSLASRFLQPQTTPGYYQIPYTQVVAFTGCSTSPGSQTRDEGEEGPAYPCPLEDRDGGDEGPGSPCQLEERDGGDEKPRLSQNEAEDTTVYKEPIYSVVDKTKVNRRVQ